MTPSIVGGTVDPQTTTPNLVSVSTFSAFQTPGSGSFPATPERQYVCTPNQAPLSALGEALLSEDSSSSYYSLSPSAFSTSASNDALSPNGSERSLLPSVSFLNDIDDQHLGYDQLALRTVLSRHNGARAHEDVGHLGFSDEDYEDELINEANMYDSDCSDFAIDVDQLAIDDLATSLTFKSPQAVLTIYGADHLYESPKRCGCALEPIDEQSDASNGL